MRLAGPATRVIALRGRTVTPGFGDAHVHPISSGIEHLQCDLHDASGPDEYLERVAAYAAANPDAAVDPRRRLVPRPLPRRARRGRRTSTASSPIGRCSCPTRTATTRGSTAAPSRSPGSPPTRPIPTTAGSPATRTARRSGRSTRAPRTWSSASSRRRRQAEREQGLLESQAHLHAHRDHELAGRPRGSRGPRHVPAGRRPRRPDRQGRRGAVVGARRRARADRGAGRAPGRGPRRALLADEREADARRHRRELHGRRASIRTSTPTATRPTTGAWTSSIPSSCSRPCPMLDALGFQAHFHALGDRAVRIGARRHRGRAQGQRLDRHAAPPRPPPAGPPRRPAALPAAGRARQRPAAVGRPRGPDGRPHDPVPRSGRVGAGSTRCARSGATARPS